MKKLLTGLLFSGFVLVGLGSLASTTVVYSHPRVVQTAMLSCPGVLGPSLCIGLGTPFFTPTGYNSPVNKGDLLIAEVQTSNPSNIPLNYVTDSNVYECTQYCDVWTRVSAHFENGTDVEVWKAVAQKTGVLTISADIPIQSTMYLTVMDVRG